MTRPIVVEAHHVGKRRELTGVHVGSSMLDVSQSGCPECAFESCRRRNTSSAGIERQSCRIRDTGDLELVVGEERRGVASGAPERNAAENIKPALLRIAEGGIIAVGISIVSAID